MHDYTIQEKLREKVIVAIVIIYIVLAIICAPLADSITNKLYLVYGYTKISYLKIIISVIMPGIGYGLLYSVYDRLVWKWLYKWHQIPNLNGQWRAEIKSELKSHTPIINMEIKQTWTKIKVSGISQYKTKTFSQTAAFVKEDGDTYFIYSYAIKRINSTKMNEATYIGYNKLCCEKTSNLVQELKGWYCNQKDITEDLADLFGANFDDAMKNKLNGCGSKGEIILTKVK